MAKKSFGNGLNTLLESSIPIDEIEDFMEVDGLNNVKARGRPRTNMKQITKTSQIGTKEGETRASFIMNEIFLERLKALSYWKRKHMKTVLYEALDAYFKKHSSDEIRKAEDAYKQREIS